VDPADLQNGCPQEPRYFTYRLEMGRALSPTLLGAWISRRPSATTCC